MPPKSTVVNIGSPGNGKRGTVDIEGQMEEATQLKRPQVVSKNNYEVISLRVRTRARHTRHSTKDATCKRVLTFRTRQMLTLA